LAKPNSLTAANHCLRKISGVRRSAILQPLVNENASVLVAVGLAALPALLDAELERDLAVRVRDVLHLQARPVLETAARVKAQPGDCR